MALHLKVTIMIVSVLTLVCVVYLILGNNFSIHPTGTITPSTKKATSESLIPNELKIQATSGSHTYSIPRKGRQQTGTTVLRAPSTENAMLSKSLIASESQTQTTSSSHTSTSPIKRTRQLSQASSASVQCSESLCLEYLSKEERIDFNKCTSRGMYLYQKKFKSTALNNGTCHFIDGTGRRPVAVGSFPGSGNTWVRGLLEKTSGICTGSVYCDFTLRSNGFAGEGVKGSSVIAFKTHNSPGAAQIIRTRFYEAALYIIRSPWDVLVAEWNRKNSANASKRNETKHSLSVGKEFFGNNQQWEQYLHTWGDRWHNSVVKWAKFGKQRPLLVVYFEDLKANTTGEVERMLDFLQVSYSKEQVEERLNQGFTLFKRNHSETFEHYTIEQKAYIMQMIAKTKKELENNGIQEVIQIQRYLSVE